MYPTKAKEIKRMFTESYARNKANSLIRDYNSYRKMKNGEACRDYKTALDNLISVADRHGWKINYTVSRAGYITLN